MNTATATGAEPRKTERVNLRASRRQLSLLRRAAEATDRSLTDLVLESAVGEAERLLGDRRLYVLTAAQFDEFERLLQAPTGPTPLFDRLFEADGRTGAGDSA
ncbi:MAG: DUF1778 domain-containing protein [Bifidobacteriaceae bacterium]|jgi:uncharacterized protein (DUF1778 family)|nr:DUF1778 domain-containing protein [Bifidobacteriaceae bacterium]